MPQGFYTVEQWMRPKDSPTSEWVPILHLDSDQSITEAMTALGKRGQAGLYRVVQTQRCIWAEMEKGKLRLHGSHVSSPKNLASLVEIFELESGRRPVEKARAERLKVKAARARK